MRLAWHFLLRAPPLTSAAVAPLPAPAAGAADRAGEPSWSSALRHFARQVPSRPGQPNGGVRKTKVLRSGSRMVSHVASAVPQDDC